ncbi:PfkB family carbohydrate kinase [Roseburia rectibacter]|jgi:fructokinase|uniref:PfkB family carbohydrate kinase n=1 Tax=Roseburia rectibacter TaxID=2763062 RepID=UPI00164CD909|nr:PfkB family carbohydrate kinase [Roseburia rectibacter]UMY99020.1 PfkB family carbohydrate kinase [Roseburia rectibacter]
MEKKVDIAALGELLINFTEAGYRQDGRKLFEQNPGGAPANLLTDAVIEDPAYFTTLAFVENDEIGERKFSFARKPGADTQLRKEELDQTLISDCKIFHFGSLSLTDEPAEGATIKAVKMAKEAGALISYDPNYRPSLWKSKEIAVEKMRSVIELADVMKVSDEESILLTGAESYEDAADRLLAMGPKLLAVTLGEKGVLMATQNRKEIIKAFKTKAVDTTGAGDSFWGGVLCGILSLNKPIEKLEWEEITKCAVLGNAVTGLCVQKRDGIPAIPSKEEVLALMQKSGC